MYKVILINMPFANMHMPSLALIQLKAVFDSEFKDRVETEVIHINQDFAQQIGVDLYDYIADSMESHNSGLGDWLFRQAAFPELADNAESYFKRFFPAPTKEVGALKKALLAARLKIGPLMDDLIDGYSIRQADLVGFTSMFMQNTPSYAMARRLKEIKPKIITVMGGANCETPMGQEAVKNVEAVDYVFSGPALKNFPKFIQQCLNQDFEHGDSLSGVFSKANVLSLQNHNVIGEELSIEAPIELNYEPFLQSFYDRFQNRNIKPVLLFETSRGCWWGERSHCTFCGISDARMPYRVMSPERALEQFKKLFHYSDKIARFEAVDYILPKNYLREVLPFVETPADNILFYEVKADLSEQDVRTLAKARVKRIQPGIESITTSTLQAMKKGTTAFQNLTLLKNCSLYGIEPIWNMLVGFPDEKKASYQKSVNDIPYLRHLPPPNGVFPVRFDRYSPYFVKAGEYGLKLKPAEYYKYIYPFSEESLERFAYYFVDINYDSEYVEEMLLWIDKLREAVHSWRKRWVGPIKHHQSKFFFKEHPKLFIKEREGRFVVYDSRFDETTEHAVDEIDKRILEVAAIPRRYDYIFSQLSEFPLQQIENKIASLRNKGLLFQEGDRCFNLVLPREPYTE